MIIGLRQVYKELKCKLIAKLAALYVKELIAEYLSSYLKFLLLLSMNQTCKRRVTTLLPVSGQNPNIFSFNTFFVFFKLPIISKIVRNMVKIMIEDLE